MSNRTRRPSKRESRDAGEFDMNLAADWSFLFPEVVSVVDEFQNLEDNDDSDNPEDILSGQVHRTFFQSTFNFKKSIVRLLEVS